MAVNIGPKIGIDGEAEYRAEMKRLVQEAKTLDSEMRAVTATYKNNDDSQKKLTEQSRILSEQLRVQTERVDILERGLSDASKVYDSNSVEVNKWKQALNEAKEAMAKTETALNDVEEGTKDVNAQLKDGEKKAFDFGDALKANLLSEAIIGGISRLRDGIKGIVSDTMEYRRIMASLEVSSANAGYTAEETAEAYETLYGVLGDNQTAATTAANLQAIGLSQKDLLTLIDASVGAWATYGDSIPIDSLSEAINETIQAGKVTGTFADVLNWSGESEEKFNEQLEKTSDQSERVNLVMGLLSRQGLPKLGKAWQNNNKDIVEANKATAEMEEITASLAKKVAPLSTAAQKGFNKIAEAAVAMVDESDIEFFTDSIEDATAFVAEEVVPVVKEFFGFISDNKDTILNVIQGVATGFAAWKAAEVVQSVSGWFKNLSSSASGAISPLTAINNLLAANPAAVVAVTLGALVTASKAIVDNINAYTSEQEKVQAVLDERSEQLADLKSSYEETTKAAYDSAASEVAQLDNASDLADELFELADANGFVEEANRDRVNFILGELSEATGIEIEMVDGQIKQYEELKSSIQDVIKQKKASLLLTAFEDVYIESIEKMREAEEGYAKSYADFVKMKSDFDKKYLNNTKGNRSQLDKERQHDMEQLSEMQKKYEEYADLREVYSEQIVLYEQATTYATEGESEKVIETLTGLNSAFNTSKEMIGQTEEEKRQILIDNYNKAQQAAMEYEKKLLQNTEGYDQAELQLLKDHAAAMEKEMKRAGVNSGEALAAGLESRENLLDRTSNDMFNIVATPPIKYTNEIYNLGANVASGFAKGLMDNLWRVGSAAEQLGNRVANVVKDVLDINSPSKVMEKIGEYTGEGFEIGLLSSFGSAVDSTLEKFDGLKRGINLPSIPLPGSSVGSSTTNNNVTYGGINVNVTANPGMDEEALADMVAYRLQTELEMREAVYA